MSKFSSRYSKKTKLSVNEKRMQEIDKSVHMSKLEHRRDVYIKLGLGKLYGIKSKDKDSLEANS